MVMRDQVTHRPLCGLIRHYGKRLKLHTHNTTLFTYSGLSGQCSLSVGPIFSPIKSSIALGNKESINAISPNKTPAVWQDNSPQQYLWIITCCLCLLHLLSPFFCLKLCYCVSLSSSSAPVSLFQCSLQGLTENQ